MHITKAWRDLVTKARTWAYSFRIDGTGYRGHRGSGSDAGIHVSGEAALQSATFFACTNLIGTSIAHLGFDIYRERKSGTREIASAHPLHELLKYEPNRQQTAHEFWQRHFFEVELYGNGYSEIERLSSTGIIALKQWEPCQVSILHDGGERVYRFQPNNGHAPIEKREHAPDDNLNVMHLRNVTLNGVTGVSTADLARQRLGLDLAVEKYGAMFFGKGGRVKDIFEYAGTLKPEQRAQWKAIFRQEYGNSDTFHEAMLLEGGVKPAGKSGATPNEAQFIETQTSTAIALCRFSGVPPTLVGILDRATYNNQEQLMLQFLTLGIAPRVDRAEQTLRRALLTREEKRGGYFIHSKLQKLLRADTRTRAEFYKIMQSLGNLSQNDVRDLEDMPRIDDPTANEYRQAANLFGTPEDAAAEAAEEATRRATA
jgi:HK97 family phage portal protein